MMELHQSSSGGGTSDPAVKRGASPEDSWVAMKSDQSIPDPPDFTSGTVSSDPEVDHGGEIRMKPGLKKYAVDVTMDPNTVNRYLFLSERNRNVEYVGEDQGYPDHPDRFDCEQVLSVESLTGHCYWEVQWSGRGAGISVSYRGIRRNGDRQDCVFGLNTQSWCLYCYNNSYFVYYNKQRTVLPAPPYHCNRVGVYLDWESGTLSFYTISPTPHTLTHLHTLYTTFTEPLYAGFWVYPNSSVHLCEIE